MTVERRNPLPVGRYWVDIIDSPRNPGARLAFRAWLAAAGRAVVVVKEEHFARLTHGRDRDWYLFDVRDPIAWPRDKGFGFPNVVQSPTAPNAAPVTSSADTAQRPPPRTWRDELDDIMGDGKSVAFIVAALYLLSRKG